MDKHHTYQLKIILPFIAPPKQALNKLAQACNYPSGWFGTPAFNAAREAWQAQKQDQNDLPQGEEKVPEKENIRPNRRA